MLATAVESDTKTPLFNNYYPEVKCSEQLLSQDCSNLPLVHTLYVEC